MFKTHVGALEDNSSVTYLRPETAQGIFVNFKNVCDTARVRVPFGIGQIGKAFRNEINPRNFTFRSREFEQMEIEFFCRATEAAQWYEYWRERRFQWYIGLGIQRELICICASTARKSLRTTPPAAPTSSTTSRSAAASSKASRTARTSICVSTCK